MSYQYEIRVVNQVDVTNKVSNSSAKKTNTNDSSPKKVSQEKTKEKESKSNLGDALSAEFLVSSIQKLGSSIQNEKIQQVNKVIGDTMKYGTLAVRMASGDITAAVTMCVDLVAQLITSLQADALKKAAEANSVDEARYAAGVLDLNGVNVSKNWWSSRYEYGR